MLTVVVLSTLVFARVASVIANRLEPETLGRIIGGLLSGSAAHFGLIQIKSVRKNNDYAIRLALYRKEGTVAHLLPEKLAMYRVRTVSLSHDAFRRKFRSHYDLFHVCDGKPAPVALFCACRNMWFGLLKKRDYEKKEA